MSSALLRALRSPWGIQRALDAMPYHAAGTAWSPRRVLRERTAHCLEGAVFAAAALRVLGFPPLLLDLEAVQDTDHVIAVFRLRGHWGAIAKSNFSGLRYREPVYRSVRELVMSYFDGYINLRGERTLRAFSRPVNLARFDRSHPDWMVVRRAALVDSRVSGGRAAHAAPDAGHGARAVARRPPLARRRARRLSPSLNRSRLVLLHHVEAHVVAFEDERDEIGPAADGAVFGESLAPSAARIREDVVVFAAERAAVHHR